MIELFRHLKQKNHFRIIYLGVLFALLSFNGYSQSLISASPNKAQLGEVLNVSISGQNVDFTTGSSSIQTVFTQGGTSIPTSWISVNPAGTVLEVGLDLSNSNSPTGFYDVEVTSTLHGLLTLTNGFEIDSVALRNSTPKVGYVGQNFNVLVTGQSVDFSTVTIPPEYIGGNNTITTTIVGTRGTDTLELNVDMTTGTFLAGNYTLNVIIPGDTLLLRNAIEVKTVNIEGTIYYDLNSNGIQDTNENGMTNIQVKLLPNNIFATSDLGGNYSFDNLSIGSYDVVVIPSPNTFTTGSSDTLALNINGLSSFNASFGINSTNPANLYDTDVSLIEVRGRCSSSGASSLIIVNNGFLVSSGVYKVVKDTAATAFESSTILEADSIDGDTAFFSYTNLNPGEYYSQIVRYTVPGVTILPPGSNISGFIMSWQTDNQGMLIPGTYEEDVLSSVVRCSYDPNDIAVSPIGKGPEGLVLHNTQLSYHIRFQNTGNDTAYRVVILDTLSNDLDLSTFEFVGASHSVNTILKQNGELGFTFNNIYLVDSIANEPESHGFVSFKINPKQGLLDSTIVNNKASIYFDFNPAVITNTVSNMYVTTIVSLQEYEVGLKANIYPNPSNGEFRIELDQKLRNASMQIYDVKGQIIYDENSLVGKIIDLDLTNYPKGVYFINVREKENFLNKKVILH